jgi:hypothetical protein
MGLVAAGAVGGILAVSMLGSASDKSGGSGEVPIARNSIEISELALEFTPQVSVVPPASVGVDPQAIISLNNLLAVFVPIASAHEIEFDGSLLPSLQTASERHGIFAPVSASLVGESDNPEYLDIAEVLLPDDANALAAQITYAAKAWISLLIGSPTVTLVAPDIETSYQGITANTMIVDGRATYAPAGRSAIRVGQPTEALTVEQLATEFDNWVASEVEAAEIALQLYHATIRQRMVAISRAHGNGRLPAEALCPIPFSPRFTMRCDVIPSLVALNDAFRAHFGRDLVVRSGYRPNPGTSNHGWGLAVDFGGQMVNFGTSEFQWMSANARRFGWGHAFWAVPGGINPQPWHWEAMDEIREMTGRWS